VSEQVKPDPDDYCMCKKCHDTYALRDGFDPTDYCDLCAHSVVESLTTENAQLKQDRDHLDEQCRFILQAKNRAHARIAGLKNELEVLRVSKSTEACEVQRQRIVELEKELTRLRNIGGVK
jgi:hypothetical protein